MAQEHLIIFDTTMRDGEQSPGASMTRKRSSASGGSSSAWDRRHRGRFPAARATATRCRAGGRARREGQRHLPASHVPTKATYALR